MALFKKEYTITTNKGANFEVQHFAERVSVKGEPISIHSYGSVIKISFYTRESRNRVLERLRNTLSDYTIICGRGKYSIHALRF